MPVTPARARELALALPDASEKAHFDRAAFRTPKRIFATLGAHGDLNLMFDPDLQTHYCAMAPEAFAPLDNAWGKNGATCCTLRKVDAATLKSALAAAHLKASTPAGRAKK
ncbi:MAG: MmcQ/YjbR family DNA-binding protein [Alphaproteobacteria bacterium]|nr:MmcQ/YjbR family DNA-binding protein [Alphaproteobacteria bacterium]